MPFTKCDTGAINNSYTLINNEFIRRYMPDTEHKFISVYIFGLYLSCTADNINTIETMENALSLTEEEIHLAYNYWEELGICVVLDTTPFTVIYNNINNGEVFRKIKPNKYKTFNKGIQTQLTGRMITPSEFNEYYTFLEDSFFEPEALLAVAKYCVALKGDNVSYNYILAVARNLSKNGIRTEEAVNDRLNKPLPFINELKEVFKALKIRRQIDFSDRDLYEKWTKGYGMEFNVIIFAAKNVKFGGMDRLDAILSDYYRNQLFSVREIENYLQTKENNIELAKNLVKKIGLYYQNVDFIIEEYLNKWLSLGFDDTTLLMIAKYCATTNIRTLNGLDNAINHFHKMGITTIQGINKYLEALIATDTEIKKLLDNMGMERRVNNNDRQSYKLWTENWGMDYAVIEYASALAASAYNPMAYLNRILSIYKSNNVFTLGAAKNYTENQNKAPAAPTSSMKYSSEREYTKDELDALFTVLDGEKV